LFILTQQDIKCFVLLFGYFSHSLNFLSWFGFFCVRLRQQSIERAMDLTDSFTWEDLPTRDVDTEYLTPAGWIPRIKLYSTRAAVSSMCFHFVQSTIRIVRKHETIIIAWYPFDWTISPFYELVNISQVTIFFD
jgi:hypothetical protein